MTALKMLLVIDVFLSRS